MSSFGIPNKSVRRWTGPYLGNYQGDLFKTYNLDLERSEGKIMFSKNLSLIADTQDTNTDTLDIIDAFLRTDADCTTRWWGLARNGNLYRTDSANLSPDTVNPFADTGWKKDALANSPADAKDFDVFENDSNDSGTTARQMMFVTRDSDISALNDTATKAWVANWWVTNKAGTALKPGVPHPICYFPYRRIMMIGSGNLIHTFSRSSSTSAITITNSRLVFPSDLQVEHIFYTANRAWILCSNLQGGRGAVIEWDGFSQTYNNIHSTVGDRPLSGVNYKEVPIIVNNRGSFLEYNGNGFAPMIRNGQVIAFPVSEDETNGLIGNVGGFLNRTMIKPRGMTVTQNGLIYINATNPNRVHERQTAGLWCLNPNSGRLYNKYGFSDSSDSSYGQNYMSDVGAVKALPNASISTSSVLVGGAYVSNGSTKPGLWIDIVNNSYIKRGYFITQAILSNEVSDFWENIWIRFRQFISSGSQITVKAMGVRSLLSGSTPIETAITWINASSFTVQLSASDDPLAVGDEVEVISGTNGGTLSHITVISGAHAAVQTITIDEILNTTTNQDYARFERWKKLGTVSDTSTYKASFAIGIDSPFVRFKVEMRGPQTMEIYDMLINSEIQTLIKQ